MDELLEAKGVKKNFKTTGLKKKNRHVLDFLVIVWTAYFSKLGNCLWSGMATSVPAED